MLKSVTLNNFKSFRSLDELRFKPITILCGTNSCGKSSILQSILLFKQTLESQNPNQAVLLNGRFVHLGTMNDVIHRHDSDNAVRFGYSFCIDKDELELSNTGKFMPIRYVISELANWDSDRKALSKALFSISISLRPGARKSLKAYISPIEVESFSFSTSFIYDDGSKVDGIKISFNREGLEDTYRLEWENAASVYGIPASKGRGEVAGTVLFANLFPISLSSTSPGTELEQGVYLVARHILRELIGNVFSRIAYIGPLREEPSRRYIYEDEVSEIGNKGENAAYIYLTQQDEFVSDHYYYDREKDSFKKTNKLKLRDAVGNWLGVMGIHDLRPELDNGVIQLNLNASRLDKTNVNIADVGFGVSQIFPIVLEGLRMPKGNTLLLEQPEIHLHPNLQMSLSDYFIALAKSGKKVVAETHSDHVINRLVRRIVEDESNEMADLIGIYFINSTESGAQYQEISINPDTGIINWPSDFFDQTAKEQEKTIRAGIVRRQARIARSKTNG